MDALKAKFITTFIVNNRWLLFIGGLKITLGLTVVALAIGIVLGVIVGVIRTLSEQNRGKNRFIIVILNGICKVYTTVIRGTPMLVQLMIWYFIVFASSNSKFWIAALGLGINSGAYVAEIIRGGILSIDPGQMEAGRSLGLGYMTVMQKVVIPQAIKNILPALGNEFITLFKDTSLASVCAVVELTKVANQVMSITYDAIFPFIGIAVMYLICVMIFTWLLGIMERSLRKSDRR